MQITTGLFANMVMQRNSKNVSTQKITGTSESTGALVASVKRGSKVLKGFALKKIGTAVDGAFSGTLAGLPVGGPYEIKLEILDAKKKPIDKLIAKNVLVGDVWILAGQSNMEGVGHLTNKQKPNAAVRAFYMDDRWDTAEDPLHQLSRAVDQAHAIINNGPCNVQAKHIGCGPGVAFGVEMQRLTKIPQGVIACAHGGTSMSQWNPDLKGEGGKSLYGAMLRRINKNGGVVSGMFWYQGCSDTGPDESKLYTDRMVNFVKAVRADLRNASLPIVVVQIASVLGSTVSFEHWNAVQEQQRRLPEQVKKLATVPAIDLSLDDMIHVCGADQNRLGRRAAGAMALMSGCTKKGALPITFKSVTVQRDKFSGNANILVKFSNVIGKLSAPGKSFGFELVQRVGELKNYLIFRIDCEGDTCVLKTNTSVSQIQRNFLHYGLGVFPYCNITDSADRSLPVMGPIYLGGTQLFGQFMTTMRVSPVLPFAGDIASVNYPADTTIRGLTKRKFVGGDFCSLRSEIVSSSVDKGIIWYAARVRCNHAMDVQIEFGYDGPVKMWIDKKEVVCDPKGTNPAIAGTKSIAVDFAQGEHEIVVALSTNDRKAWGIFLQASRKGIDPAVLINKPESVPMPELIEA